MGDLVCECGKDFDNKGALKSHQNFCDESDREAPEISYDKIECPECGDMVAKPQLKNHRNSETCKKGGTFETIRKEGINNKFQIRENWK